MIQDYVTLRQDIAKYLRDASLDPEIPDFVQLCTERLNTDLYSFGQETEEVVDVTTGEADIPETLGQILSFELDAYPTPPRYLAPQAFSEYPRWDANQRTPQVYTIEALKVRVRPTPDKTTNARIVHIAKLPNLINDTDTNVILLSTPSLYLYGSLLASEPRVGNDPRMLTWATLYQERVEALNKETQAVRFPRGGLRQTMSARPSRLGRPRTAKPSS